MQRTMYSVSDSVSSTGLCDDLNSGPRFASRGTAASCSVTRITHSLTITEHFFTAAPLVFASSSWVNSLKPTTHAPETGARNRRHKFDASMCHTIWHQIFTGAGFWSQIETALFLCQKPAGMAFSDWLTDLFTFRVSTVWDSWIWGSTWDLRWNCNASWEF